VAMVELACLTRPRCGALREYCRGCSLVLTQPQSKTARNIIYIERMSVPDDIVDNDKGQDEYGYTC
jgi:hypothetical protein